MTIKFSQTRTAAETSAADSVVTMGSTPLDGSALFAAIGLTSAAAVTGISQTGADWNLLYEAATAENADEVNGSAVRAQLWAAFDVFEAGDVVTISFSGGTTARGIIVAEYTGDIFKFPNPADRVVGAFGTSAASPGPADTGAGGTTREADELWVAAFAIDNPALNWDNATSPFSIRDQEAIGNAATGRVGLADTLNQGAGALQAVVSHDAGNADWAITAAAIRGILQVPVDAATVPEAAEPVTEMEDYSTDGIDKLASQFRAKS